MVTQLQLKNVTKLLGAALLACGGVAAQASVIGSVSYGADSLDGFYGMVGGNDTDVDGNKKVNINKLPVNWGGGWKLAAKDNTASDDDESNIVNSIKFKVDAGAKSTTGRWTLTGSESGVNLAAHPIHLDIVAVLKSSTQFAMYYFQNVSFNGSAGGAWNSPSFSKQGNQQALSHLSIYVREGNNSSVLSDEMFVSQQATTEAVPEPGSLALAGAGLFGMLALSRRKQRRGA